MVTKELMAAKKGEKEFPLLNLDSWLEDFEKEFAQNTDRGAVIVSATILAELLRMTLETFMVQEDVVDDLFGPYKPLSTFSARVQIAFALGLISDQEHNYLEIIRGIRNQFAHTAGALSFENQSISDRCQNLQLPKGVYIPYKMYLPSAGHPEGKVELTAKRTVTQRDQFKTTVSYLMVSLMARWVLALKARRSTQEGLLKTSETIRLGLEELDDKRAEFAELIGRRNELLEQEQEKVLRAKKTEDPDDSEAIDLSEPPIVKFVVSLRRLQEEVLKMVEEAEGEEQEQGK